jgi:hypothetical protein
MVEKLTSESDLGEDPSHQYGKGHAGTLTS